MSRRQARTSAEKTARREYWQLRRVMEKVGRGGPIVFRGRIYPRTIQYLHAHKVDYTIQDSGVIPREEKYRVPEDPDMKEARQRKIWRDKYRKECGLPPREDTKEHRDEMNDIAAGILSRLPEKND